MEWEVKIVKNILMSDVKRSALSLLLAWTPRYVRCFYKQTRMTVHFKNRYITNKYISNNLHALPVILIRFDHQDIF